MRLVGRYDGCHVQLSIYNLKTSNFSWTTVAGGCLAASCTQWKLLHLRNINLTDNWHCRLVAAVLEQSGDLPSCTDQVFTPSLPWLLGWCGCGGEASGGWLQLGRDVMVVMGCCCWWWWWREATFFPWLVWHCGPFCIALSDFGGTDWLLTHCQLQHNQSIFFCTL